MSVASYPPEPPSPVESKVLDDVRAILAEVIGQDYLADLSIDFATSFYGDLEIESIELVALAEELETRYGDRIDFPAWIATMEVDEIIAMTVGELVTFIARSL